MRLVICASGDVGRACLRWLGEHHWDDVILVVSTGLNSEIESVSNEFGWPCIAWEGSEHLAQVLSDRPADLGILAWWPHLIREPLISSPARGFINFHPSFLPFNRGKHYNFWALVEQSPFGVTIHRVAAEVDAGPIIFQKSISYGWSDTGGTLYEKAQAAMIQLFTETYDCLRTGDYTERPQNLTQGSRHLARELDAACQIDLDAPTTARSLLNLLRARTFAGKPACTFIDRDQVWEVRVTITEKT